MTRFAAPLNPQEHFRCAKCREEYHYTQLDDYDRCPNCAAEELEREEIEWE